MQSHSKKGHFISLDIRVPVWIILSQATRLKHLKYSYLTMVYCDRLNEQRLTMVKGSYLRKFHYGKLIIWKKFKKFPPEVASCLIHEYETFSEAINFRKIARLKLKTRLTWIFKSVISQALSSPNIQTSGRDKLQSCYQFIWGVGFYNQLIKYFEVSTHAYKKTLFGSQDP